MRVRSCTLCLLLFFAYSSSAQVSGYMGKKNVVTIGSTANLRLLSWLDGPADFIGGNGNQLVSYDESNHTKYSTKMIRYDLRLAYSRVITRKLMIGAEMSYEHMKLPVGDGNLTVSSPEFNVYGIYATCSFFKAKRIPPIGLSMTVGIGPKIYAFDFGNNYRSNIYTPMDPFPKYKSHMAGFNMFFNLSTRRLLASFLALDIGMRVHTGFVFKNGLRLDSGVYSPENSSTEYTKTDTKSGVFRENMGNLLSFNLGLSFLL